jgi:hypothetical protein
MGRIGRAAFNILLNTVDPVVEMEGVFRSWKEFDLAIEK